MNVAHLSDLHVLGDDDVPFHRYLNKRITGYANIKLKRGAVHKRTVVQALARELKTRHVDHVVVTGDVSNRALEGEFASVRRLLEDDLGLHPDQVSLVPGNHDLYTRGSSVARRFFSYFGDYLKSDIPGLSVEHAAGSFPFVRLRGPLAFIGLSTAVPVPPLCSMGHLGDPQLDALAQILAHPEVSSRLPVLLLHHPPHNPPNVVEAFRRGLRDASKLRRVVAGAPHVVALHGHEHERMHLRFSTAGGSLDSIGATSASLLHEHPDRMAGFNWYQLGGEGPLRPSAFVLEASREGFREQSIPLTMASASA
jgi:3',5'-cyclic AMP phosphodiesterase CpdA